MTGNSLGTYLKSLRKSNGYSQEFVASSLNIIRQTYSHYETGRIIPPVDSLYNLAMLYHISSDVLLGYAMEDLSTKENGNRHFTSISSAGCAPATPVISPQDSELLSYYHQLDLRDQEDILDFIKLKANKKRMPY